MEAIVVFSPMLIIPIAVYEGKSEANLTTQGSGQTVTFLYGIVQLSTPPLQVQFPL